VPVSESLSGVVVTGTGRVPVRPDVLAARLGAEVVAGSVQGALDRCSVALAELSAVLHDGGVAEADLMTAGASVYAAHDNQGNQRGWTAAQQVTAKLRDLGTAGDLISRAIEVAGDDARLHDLSFEIADDTEARLAARRLAFADARAKAELYAGLAGRELGPVRSVREGEPAGGGPRSFEATTFGTRSASVPIAAGSLDVSVTVAVHWDFVG
jgi:uncharacterized protein YggE